MLEDLRIHGEAVAVLTDSWQILTRNVVTHDTKFTHYFGLFYLFGELFSLQRAGRHPTVNGAIQTSL